MSCHISMSCIDERLNKRRSYELIAHTDSNTVITRWGRVGQKIKRSKSYHLDNQQKLKETIERILSKRLKHGYRYTQYQDLTPVWPISLQSVGLQQPFGQMYLL